MSKAQEDLRERLENAITAATQEWDLCAYDIVGVLCCLLFCFQHQIDSLDEGDN